ncbi:alpha/beta hydrolase [Algiphilus sp. NNCM1]|nr:alpha/beta hydrolase [Algiphilus acroporae]MCI5063547.1 alpha/beta hydrolase [Algiphilus sp.]
MTALSEWRAAGTVIDFGGHRIFYRQHGRLTPGARVLVCIHGFPTASWDWHRLWPALIETFDVVIAPDMLGFGFSDKPRGHRYTIQEQCDLHEHMLSSLGITETTVLAHDYGDTVAQEWLARLIDGSAVVRPRAIALLNGGLFPETHRARLVQKLLASPVGPWLAVAMGKASFARSLCAVFGAKTQPSQTDLDAFWALASRDGGKAAMARLIHYMAERRSQRARWVGALQESPIPIRVIDGLDDPVSGAHMVERYRALVAQPDVMELPGIGHYPQVEAPEQVLDALRDWPPFLAGGARA